jgi:hypothetical protein
MWHSKIKNNFFPFILPVSSVRMTFDVYFDFLCLSGLHSLISMECFGLNLIILEPPYSNIKIYKNKIKLLEHNVLLMSIKHLHVHIKNLSSLASLAVPSFSTFFHKGIYCVEGGGELLNTKCMFGFLYNFV